MVETSDSDEETHRQTRVYVSGYITVFHVSAAAFTREAEHFLLHVSDRRTGNMLFRPFFWR